MTSNEILNAVNPRQMRMQEDQQKLQEAMTGVSKQMIVSNAIMSRMGMAQPAQQPPQPVQGAASDGWGKTA